MSPKDCAYIVERLAIRFMALVADHSRQLTEHRAAFGARTEADAKIIAGMRSEIVAARMAVLERDSLISERAKLQSIVNEQSASAKEAGEKLGWTANESAIQAVERVVTERDGLLTQVQDLVAERDALRAEVAELKTQLERLTSWAAKNQAARETLQNEIEKLKSQTPKQHPVKVGEWVVRTAAGAQLAPIGMVAQVVSVADGLPDGYEYVIAGGRWHSDYCEPCDPPNHDTEAGKAAAESAIQGDRSGGIVVGDVVRATFWKPGQMSTVTQILPDGRLILEVSSEPWRVDEVVKLTRKCVGADEAWTDVRKVTT